MTNLDLSLVTRERGEPQVPPGLRTQGALVHAAASHRDVGFARKCQFIASAAFCRKYQFLPGCF